MPCSRDAPVVYDKGENIRDLLIEEIRSRGGARSRRLRRPRVANRSRGTAAALRALFRVPTKPLPPGPRDTVLLRVLATADLHGALLPKAGSRRGAGGVAAAGGADG